MYETKKAYGVNWGEIADRLEMVIAQINYFPYFLVFFIKRKQDFLLIRIFF
jgi:hypothetical protein